MTKPQSTITMYYLLSLLTAPGVVVHELGHALFCVLAGVKIRSIRLFRFGNPAGYVVHDEPRGWLAALLISTGPISANTTLALVAFSRFRSPVDLTTGLLLWLGFAIGLHAIPSNGDVKTLLAITNHHIRRNPLVVIGYPIIFVLFILNLLRRLHIDIVFAGLLFWFGAFWLKM